MTTDTLHGRAAAPAADRRFYLAAWRWHFYAGLYVAPFLVMLAVTGLMMLYISAFSGRDGEKIAVAVPAQAHVLAVATQADAALGAVPGGRLVEWIKPDRDDRASVFRIASEGVQKMVAVDPYTGKVLESWDRRDGWYDFADNIHGTLLIGNAGDRLIEIAAGFGIVLVITGLYLWWPRGESWANVLLARTAGNGRNRWKGLHRAVGFYISALLVVFLLSGMSWTGIWGEKFVQAWSTFPAEKWDNVPLSDDIHAAMNHGGPKNVPWALEQTPMPASGSQAGVQGIAPGTPVTIDAIDGLAARLGYQGRFRVSFPAGETGVWTINQDTMSNDAETPTSDRTVHVDRHTGRILADVGFADYSLPGKAMAVGIAFHEGDMGLWNIALNTLFCLAVVFMSISGLAMWWMRRPARAGARLFTPRVPGGIPHWRSAMLVMLVVSLAFPLVGLTLVAVMALDLLVLARVPMLRKVFA
ncbi:PepSY-associated TM helix domain-containing protein [Stappia sp. ICDLI1TA098]